MNFYPSCINVARIIEVRSAKRRLDTAARAKQSASYASEVAKLTFFTAEIEVDPLEESDLPQHCCRLNDLNLETSDDLVTKP